MPDAMIPTLAATAHCSRSSFTHICFYQLNRNYYHSASFLCNPRTKVLMELIQKTPNQHNTSNRYTVMEISWKSSTEAVIADDDSKLENSIGTIGLTEFLVLETTVIFQHTTSCT